MFVQMISSKPLNISFPNMVLWCIIMNQCHAKKIDLLFSKSLQELIWSKYDNFYCIFWNAYPFATKLGLIVQYHKPECFMEKLDCCVQGQGHRKISKCQWMFVKKIFSDLLNLLLQNLVWWCIIMSQIFFQKDWFAVFKVKVTVKENVIKICLFNVSSELLVFLQLNLVWWYIIIRWIVLWKDWIALLWSRSRSQKRFRIPVNVHLDNISWTAEPNVTKLSMVMQYHGPKCYARRLVCCFQVQGHSEDSYDQIWLVELYLLNCWSFCSQI